MTKSQIKDAKDPLDDIPVEDLDEESLKICLHHEEQITKYFKRTWRPNKDVFNRWLLKLRDDYLLIAIKYASQCHRGKPTFKTAEKLWELSEKLSDRFEGKPATKPEAPIEKQEAGVVLLPPIDKVNAKSKDAKNDKTESNLETSSGSPD